MTINTTTAPAYADLRFYIEVDVEGFRSEPYDDGLGLITRRSR